MSDGVEGEAYQIEISPKLRRRFEKIKQECKDEYTPDPTDEVMFKSLLDEWQFDPPDHELRYCTVCSEEAGSWVGFESHFTNAIYCPYCGQETTELVEEAMQ